MMCRINVLIIAGVWLHSYGEQKLIRYFFNSLAGAVSGPIYNTQCPLIKLFL